MSLPSEWCSFLTWHYHQGRKREGGERKAVKTVPTKQKLERMCLSEGPFTKQTGREARGPSGCLLLPFSSLHLMNKLL